MRGRSRSLAVRVAVVVYAIAVVAALLGPRPEGFVHGLDAAMSAPAACMGAPVVHPHELVAATGQLRFELRHTLVQWGARPLGPAVARASVEVTYRIAPKASPPPAPTVRTI